MRQEEFLNSFREALIGKVPDNVIQDNLNYYRNYISSQINSGRREEDVLGSLGDPRLLAKTIEESNKFAMGEERQSYYQDNNTGAYRNQNDDQEQKTGYHKTVNLPGWLLSIIGLALMMLVIVVAFSLISFFAPAILALSLVLLVIHLIRSWQRRLKQWIRSYVDRRIMQNEKRTVYKRFFSYLKFEKGYNN